MGVQGPISLIVVARILSGVIEALMCGQGRLIMQRRNAADVQLLSVYTRDGIICAKRSSFVPVISSLVVPSTNS